MNGILKNMMYSNSKLFLVLLFLCSIGLGGCSYKEYSSSTINNSSISNEISKNVSSISSFNTTSYNTTSSFISSNSEEINSSLYEIIEEEDSGYGEFH